MIVDAFNRKVNRAIRECRGRGCGESMTAMMMWEEAPTPDMKTEKVAAA